MKALQKRRVLVRVMTAAALLVSGCGDSENFVFTNNQPFPQPTNPVTAPLAVNDSFNSLGNATLNIEASGVLGNDTPNGGEISAFDTIGNNGGTLTLRQDGSFSYTPVFGFVGRETFNYTLRNAGGESTAVIALTSTGRGFFVDNTAPSGGNGSQASPFNNVAAALAVAQAGDTVFISRGDGNTTGLTGQINLPAGVDLIGEGSGLVVAQTVVPAGQPPTITGPVVCGGDNTIAGLRIDGSANNAIVVDGVGNVTITNNTISNAADDLISVDSLDGDLMVTENVLAQPAEEDDYIDVDGTAEGSRIDISLNTFSNQDQTEYDSLVEVEVSGTGTFPVSISGNTATGTSAPSFFSGFSVFAEDGAQVALTINDNILRDFLYLPILVDTETDSTISGSISGNTIEDVLDHDGIQVYSDGDLTIDGNVISEILGDGIELNPRGNPTYIISNNQISNCGDDGLESDGGTVASIALRGNTFSGSDDEDLEIYWGSTQDLCMEIVGNSFTRALQFNEDGDPGEINVELFDDLDEINNFNGVAFVFVVGGTINDVIDGFCQIP